MSNFSPPALAVKSFRALMDLIQYKKPGELVCAKDMSARGLSSHLSRSSMNGLRFLGFIDEDDKVTADLESYFTGGKSLGHVLKRRYGDVHTDKRGPKQQTRLGAHWDLSERIEALAYKMYVHLADRAQTLEEKPMAKKAAGTTQKEGPTLSSGAQVVFSLQIGKHTTDKDIVKMLRTVEKGT